MMKEKFYKIIYYLIPIILVLLAVCGIFTNSMWADEVFTVELLSHPFKEIIKIAILDVHPPLYYLIYLSHILLDEPKLFHIFYLTFFHNIHMQKNGGRL